MTADKIRERLGDDIGLAMRLNAYDKQPSPDSWGYKKAGERIVPDMEEPSKLCMALREKGADIIDISASSPSQRLFGEAAGQEAGMMSEAYDPPSAPIRLMIAFALLRRGLGVTSGMSATAGERYVPMAIRRSPRTVTNIIVRLIRGDLKQELSRTGIRSISPAANRVPRRINGFRFPSLLVHLSEIPPNSGSRKSARILSIAMIIPEIVSFI